jgi:hypothetical protein
LLRVVLGLVLGCGAESERTPAADSGRDAGASEPADAGFEGVGRARVVLHAPSGVLGSQGVDDEEAWFSGGYVGAVDIGDQHLEGEAGIFVATVNRAGVTNLLGHAPNIPEHLYQSPRVLRRRSGGGLVLYGTMYPWMDAALTPDSLVWLDRAGRPEHSITRLANISFDALDAHEDGGFEVRSMRREGEEYNLGDGPRTASGSQLWISRVEADGRVTVDVAVAEIDPDPVCGAQASLTVPHELADGSRWLHVHPLCGYLRSAGGQPVPNLHDPRTAMLRVGPTGEVLQVVWLSSFVSGPDGAEGVIGRVRPRETYDPGNGTTIGAGNYFLRLGFDGVIDWVRPVADGLFPPRGNYVFKEAVSLEGERDWPFLGEPRGTGVPFGRGIAAIVPEDGSVRWWRILPSQGPTGDLRAGFLAPPRADGGIWWWAVHSGALDLGDARVEASSSPRMLIAGFAPNGETELLEEVPLLQAEPVFTTMQAGSGVLYLFETTPGGSQLIRFEPGQPRADVSLPAWPERCVGVSGKFLCQFVASSNRVVGSFVHTSGFELDGVRYDAARDDDAFREAVTAVEIVFQ